LNRFNIKKVISKRQEKNAPIKNILSFCFEMPVIISKLAGTGFENI
jgi:hypothetical protein